MLSFVGKMLGVKAADGRILWFPRLVAPVSESLNRSENYSNTGLVLKDGYPHRVSKIGTTHAAKTKNSRQVDLGLESLVPCLHSFPITHLQCSH